MVPLPKRLRIAVLAVLAVALAIGLPGPFWFAVGLIALLALPQLLEPRIGVVLPNGEGATIITARTSGDRSFRIVRGWGTAVWLVYAWLGQTSPGHHTNGLMAQAAVFAFAFTFVSLPMFAARLLDGRVRGHSVTLDRTTLTASTAEGPHVVAYVELKRVEIEKKTLWLVTATQRIAVPVDGPPALVAEIAARIEQARSREHAVVASTKELHRPSGMSAREWLQRLDALAATAHAAGAYRGAGLDEEELWRVLGDADADAEVRAGAARVLTAADAKARIRIAGTEAPSAVRTRIDLALEPDVETAAEALETLERAELRRSAGL